MIPLVSKFFLEESILLIWRTNTKTGLGCIYIYIKQVSDKWEVYFPCTFKLKGLIDCPGNDEGPFTMALSGREEIILRKAFFTSFYKNKEMYILLICRIFSFAHVAQHISTYWWLPKCSEVSMNKYLIQSYVTCVFKHLLSGNQKLPFQLTLS